ncbi:MAG: recombinase family protein [Anaerolineae bacterium]|nr:recombinase family protein [Anaerolineae bacterium]
MKPPTPQLPPETADLVNGNRRFRPRGANNANPADLVALPCLRLAFVYQRLSSYEQVRKSIYSIQMQDALADLAREEGYPEELVYVERRDLGISGTTGREEREGLAYLIELIEQDRVEAIYVIHVSRLFRDQTLIDGLAFGELCKKHNVVIVMPTVRLNLRDKMHMRLYRIELERSADELDLLRARLLGARDFKARQGLYAGGSIAPGYILNVKQGTEGYGKITPYEPHAELIRVVFRQFVEGGGSWMSVVHYCRQNDLFFPPFPDEIQDFLRGRHSFLNSRLTSKGYPVTPGKLKNIISNPVYIGWCVFAGQVVSTSNHPPIVDEDLFWEAQRLRVQVRRHGKAAERSPHMLQHLLYCDNHDGELFYISPASHDGPRGPVQYTCTTTFYNQIDDTSCFASADYVIEDPIRELVISRCELAQYAEPVLSYLETELEENKSRADSYKRDYARLTAQIERLKHDLDFVDTPFQRKAIWEEIEAKTSQREALSHVENHPVGRVISAADVQNVRACLARIKDRWDSFPNDIKNEFLRLVLQKIILRHDEYTITARVIWQTGREDRIRIWRPRPNATNVWTAEEDAIIREHYPSTPQEEVLKLLDGRTWLAIKHRARGLGVCRERKAVRYRVAYPNSRKPWTAEDDALLKRYYEGEISKAECMTTLARSWGAVLRRGESMGLEWKPRHAFRKFLRWEVLEGEDEEPSSFTDHIGSTGDNDGPTSAGSR